MDLDNHWYQILDTVLDGLMIVDPAGTIRYVNNSLAEMTGYLPQELLGKSCQTFKCSTCVLARGGAVKGFCMLFEEQDFRRCRCLLTKKNGERLPVIKNASVLKDNRGNLIGAVETFTDISELAAKEGELSRVKRELFKESTFEGLVGKDPKMVRVYDLIKVAASSDAPVLITGATGTGKELVAKAIHNLSKRREHPFIRVNCAALNEQLLESELFGHVKGAFTGAIRDRIGRFEAAHRGTLFLDEIGDFPPGAQVKLLRAIQEKEIERVGDQVPIPVDVRIVTATNKDLWHMVKTGKFREDLYYRIAVIPIELPSLSERSQDIPQLVEYFMARLRVKTGKQIYGVTKGFLDKILEYSWPGNVRELINTLEYAFAVCNKDVLDIQDLPSHISIFRDLPKDSKSGHIPKEAILSALEASKGNRTMAAKLLNISRVTLWKKLKEYNIVR